MSFALPVLPGRISVDDHLQNASVFTGLCEISAALRTTVRDDVIWSTEVASPRSLESGPHNGGRGSPVLLHKGSDLEVRAMTDDVQYTGRD